MPPRSAIDRDALEALATHRVVAVADLVAAGVPSSTVARRVRAGTWLRLSDGVLYLGSGPPDPRQRLLAALTYAGEDSMVTGPHALTRHGLRRAPESEQVRVLIPAQRRRRSTGLVIAERTDRLPEPAVRDDVPIAPLERAVLDTARHLPSRDDVRAVIAEAVQRRRTTVARLVGELEAGSQRGTALPRVALGEVDAGIRSAGEGWGLDVHRRSGLPPGVWNPRLFAASGRFIACPDCWLDDVAMAWEIDSLEFHLSPEDWDETLRRRAAMTGCGVIVAHTRPRRLLTEPKLVIEELWGAYRLAASRPRPDVRIG